MVRCTELRCTSLHTHAHTQKHTNAMKRTKIQCLMMVQFDDGTGGGSSGEEGI